MRKKIILCVVLLCMVAFCLPTFAFAANESQEYIEIDEYLQAEFGKTRIPGMSVVIVNKDDVLFEGTYGECNSVDNPFIIGSMSKSFTAIAIMQLVEQGKVALDNFVSEYIPELEIGSKITVRQLLNQTSGIETYQTRNNLSITDTYGIHQYANVNYGLLGEIIENVSGKSYSKYVEQNIYAPIGMTNSYTSLEDGKSNGLISGYRNYFGIPIAQEVLYSSNSDYWSSVASGYLISSAFDMGKYLQMYLNNGSNVVLPDSVNTVWYDNVYDEPSGAYYGMGWSYTEQYAEPMLSHSGLVENYSSFMFVLPESGIGVVMLVNMNDYFVSNQLMGTIGSGVISLVTGQSPTQLSGTSYTSPHLVFNCVYAFVLIASILPLLLLKRWSRKIDRKKKGTLILIFGLLHVIFPTLLLLVPALAGTPFFVLKGYAPDLFIVLLISSTLAYITGIIKVIVFIRKGKPEKEQVNI